MTLLVSNIASNLNHQLQRWRFGRDISQQGKEKTNAVQRLTKTQTKKSFLKKLKRNTHHIFCWYCFKSTGAIIKWIRKKNGRAKQIILTSCGT